MQRDNGEWLVKIAPHDPVIKYQPNRTGEDDVEAHIKRQIIGREVVVAVTEGRLEFGTWERTFCGEFDGRGAQARAGKDRRVARRPGSGAFPALVADSSPKDRGAARSPSKLLWRMPTRPYRFRKFVQTFLNL